ncbi:MAG: phosphoribosylamine--glycine ligase [Candidatus Bathyarchaeia archaeon]
MEKVGVLVVSYGAREASIIDAYARSREYKTEIFVVDKQKNPFNLRKATEHVVVPDLDVSKICKFAARRRDKIDFGIVGPEKPIINGIRDVIENEAHIPVICPTKRCAIEASKVTQRRIFEEAAPEVNPRFRVFSPKEYRNAADAKKALYMWLDELDNQAVVKPDSPAAGKGVGVWGDHFNTREQLFNHFAANFSHGDVIVEEKVEGEESSFQAFCDGKSLVALPETRDYKRAFDGDKGPNTGGMGSYKNVGDLLPFMTVEDWEREVEIVNKIFNSMRKWASGEELRGVPFYVAFMHTAEGLKILENNSRPGDPEIMNIMPLLKDDFVDVCFKILEGNLSKIRMERKASVVTYKVPPSYGGYAEEFPDKVAKEEVGKPVKLEGAYNIVDGVRVYPAAVELRDDKVYALTSRAVAIVGVGDTLEEARRVSLEGVNAVEGGALWSRSDIASSMHVRKSVEHMEILRRKAR